MEKEVGDEIEGAGGDGGWCVGVVERGGDGAGKRQNDAKICERFEVPELMMMESAGFYYPGNDVLVRWTSGLQRLAVKG